MDRLHLADPRGDEDRRVVFQVIRRTITAAGQRLLLPEVEVHTWWTSLLAPPAEVIELYHRHATSEQFHSELKTDMDLERLPSGKFAVNALVLRLGMVAYNALRLYGQTALRPGPGQSAQALPSARKQRQRLPVIPPRAPPQVAATRGAPGTRRATTALPSGAAAATSHRGLGQHLLAPDSHFGV